jgi:hypothetical protein
MNKKVLALLSVAHLVTDVNQGALPALLPHHLGMASGLMVGFPVGTGGVGVTLLGMIADAWGVPAAMKAILILPILGFILSMLLHYPPQKTDEVRK